MGVITSGLARLALLKGEVLLGELSDQYNGDLKAAIETATQIANKITGCQLVSTVYTDERMSGTGTNKLTPPEYPITEIGAVKIWDGSAFTTETAAYYELIREFWINYPALGQESGATYPSWPGSPAENIKLTYTAGFDTTDWDTLEVVLDVASFVTAPAVGDVLTQANTGATITVTESSAVTNYAKGVSTGALSRVDSNTFTSDDAGATMNPATVAPVAIAQSLPAFAVPEDLEYAVAKMAALIWKEGAGDQSRLGITTRSRGGENESYIRFTGMMPEEVKQILRGYTKRRFA